MTDRPDEHDETGPRRDAAGRWLPGSVSPNPNGRPCRPDLFTLAKREARKRGTTIEAEVLEVLAGLVARAKAGDSQAGKLVLSYLALPPEPDAPLVTVDARAISLGSTGDPRLLEGAPPGPIVRGSPYDRLYAKGCLARDSRYGPPAPEPRVAAAQLREVVAVVDRLFPKEKAGPPAASG